MHLITFLKLQIPSPMIDIRLLLTIGRLRLVCYDMEFIQSLMNQIGTQTRSLTHIKPPYKIPTPPTIQGFIGSHGNGCMKAIIISKQHQRQMLILIPFEINNTSPKHIFNCFNSTFRLTICLGMKSILNFTLVPNLFCNDLQNLDVLCTPIRYDV